MDAANRRRGVLIVLFDRTDLLLRRAFRRPMLDTLRAFNHEFLNKLHIILSLPTDRGDSAGDEFITNSSLVSSQSVRETANCIRVPKSVRL